MRKRSPTASSAKPLRAYRVSHPAVLDRLRPYVEGRAVWSIGCGDGAELQMLETLGARDVDGCEKEESVARFPMHRSVTISRAANWVPRFRAEVVYLSMPINMPILGIVPLLVRGGDTVIYIGSNSFGTACGGLDLWVALLLGYELVDAWQFYNNADTDEDPFPSAGGSVPGASDVLIFRRIRRIRPELLERSAESLWGTQPTLSLRACLSTRFYTYPIDHFSSLTSAEPAGSLAFLLAGIFSDPFSSYLSFHSRTRALDFVHPIRESDPIAIGALFLEALGREGMALMASRILEKLVELNIGGRTNAEIILLNRAIQSRSVYLGQTLPPLWLSLQHPGGPCHDFDSIVDPA